MAHLLPDSKIGGLQIASEDYVSSKVQTDVPANAKFTDTTYDEISEAEINTGTSATLRSITARRITFILNKVSTLINNAISALNKSNVGLDNVDNVKQLPMSQKGVPNGVAELDSTGKVPASQLPSYVDDVLEYNNLASFPSVGEDGKIYVDKTTNKTYRWSGTVYVQLNEGVVIGETSSTAYRGDRGKIAYDHSQSSHAPSNAQKNSDITKAEIEAKLTGAVTTHTHGISGVTGLQTELDKITNATNLVAGANINLSLSEGNLVIASTSGGEPVSWDTVINKPSSFTPSVHTHDASEIATGVLSVQRMGTGTPSASNYLRGDGTWGVPSGTNYVGSTSITLSSNSFQRAALTGDVTAPANSNATTLANSGVTAGTYNNVATQVRPFTVDAKGRITSIGTAVNIAPTWASITGVPSSFTPSTHTHSASDISSGVLDVARIPTGTTGSTVSLGNHTHNFASITGKPTTTAGYGITDAGVFGPYKWQYNSVTDSLDLIKTV